MGMQYDVTDNIGIDHLLSAALNGEHTALRKSREMEVKDYLASMKVGSDMVVDYFEEKAGEMWLNFIGEMLQTETPCNKEEEPAKDAPNKLSGRWRGTGSEALGGY